jgi:hypothetical protein
LKVTNYVLGERARCPSCGFEFVPPEAFAKPGEALQAGVPAEGYAPSTDRAEGTRYPALEMMARLYKAVAVVSAAAGLAGACWGAVMHEVRVALLCVAWLAVVPLSLWAFAEIIRLAIDVEDNTRRAARRISPDPMP